MGDITEFKRMNFFTGFFTTADDWKTEQDYHRRKLKIHNQGMHTPGVMRGIAEEFNVIADADGNIEVQSGTAIDGDGNEICLAVTGKLPLTAYAQPTTVYVTLSYAEVETDPVTNVKMPDYSGNTRVTEQAILNLATTVPDNRKVLELARVSLPANATKVANPPDPSQPGAGEIDRRYIVFAGSVGITDSVQWLDPVLQQRLELLMTETRKNFAALATRFATPSVADARQAALTIQMLACVGFMRTGQLTGLLSVLADTERDAGQEMGTICSGLAKFKEYQDYVDAVAALRSNLTTTPDQTDKLLLSQGIVALAARELAEIVMQPPVASAGNDQTMTTVGVEAQAILDASASKAFGGKNIISYQWDLKSSAVPPMANPGSDQVIFTTITGNEGTVTLDASASTAQDGEQIVKYTWDEV
ncbi:MAG TPA: hypothetical protein VFG19_15370 [Geobacteraceae bacterium]|nr:hypothetical protein [Geobacteraceae bacterium]